MTAANPLSGRAAWRRRIGAEAAKKIHTQRGAASTAKTVDAGAKVHRGLDRLAVCGLVKACEQSADTAHHPRGESAPVDQPYDGATGIGPSP